MFLNDLINYFDMYLLLVEQKLSTLNENDSSRVCVLEVYVFRLFLWFPIIFRDKNY
jgi:hypothetical protein